MIHTALTLNPFLYLILPIAFVLGSIPFGILFTRSKGIDIRSFGSRNIGATNVLRAAGKMPAIFTLLGDILKGALAVVLCKILIIKVAQSHQAVELSITIEDLWLGMIGLTAVLGHMFSIFLSFRGGKGVATGLGVIAVYSPISAVVLLLIWITAALITRYSSLAAIVAFIALPFVFAFLDASIIKIFFGVLLAFLIVFRHKSNIKNIINGTESKIGNKK